MNTITETIRQAVRDSGETRYRISKGSQVAYAALHRFVRGREPMGTTLDRLAKYLGLELTKKGK